MKCPTIKESSNFVHHTYSVLNFKILEKPLALTYDEVLGKSYDLYFRQQLVLLY